ncbi:MAG: hypothetical protein KDB27_18450, partial [Planctomycetales bacterium]|nr:hypothetical protein [Planctomycetales bacterium]
MSTRFLIALSFLALLLTTLHADSTPVDTVADELLREFDRDGDKKLNRAELQAALASLAETDSLSPNEKSTVLEQLTEPQFIRIRRDDKKQPIALDTSVVTYKSPTSGVTVDLIGAVHIADKAYFRNLNRRFRDYDVLLYE